MFRGRMFLPSHGRSVANDDLVVHGCMSDHKIEFAEYAHEQTGGAV